MPLPWLSMHVVAADDQPPGGDELDAAEHGTEGELLLVVVVADLVPFHQHRVADAVDPDLTVVVNVVVQHPRLVADLDPGVLVVPHFTVLDDPAGGPHGHDGALLLRRGVVLDDESLDPDVAPALLEREGRRVLAIENGAGLAEEYVARLRDDSLIGVGPRLEEELGAGGIAVNRGLNARARGDQAPAILRQPDSGRPRPSRSSGSSCGAVWGVGAAGRTGHRRGEEPRSERARRAGAVASSPASQLEGERHGVPSVVSALEGME